MSEVQSAVTATTATSNTATYGATPTQNNLLVAVGLSFGETLTMVSSGWTLLDSGSRDNGFMVVWWKLAGVSESTTVQVSAVTGFRNILRIYEHDGNATSGTIEAHLFTNAAVDLWTGMPPIPAGDKRTVLAFFGYNTTDGSLISPTAGPYHTTQTHSDDSGAAVGSRITLRSHMAVGTPLDFSPYDEALYFGDSKIRGCASLIVVKPSSSTAITKASGTGTITETRHATGTGTSTSPAATYGGTPAEDSLLVAVLKVTSGDTTTVTGPSGWALAGTLDLPIASGAAGGNIRWQVWYKIAGASESTAVNFTLSGSKTWKVAAVEYVVPADTSLVIAPWGHSHTPSVDSSGGAYSSGPLLSPVQVPNGDGIAIIVVSYFSTAPTGPSESFVEAFHGSGLSWLTKTYTESGHIGGKTDLAAEVLTVADCIAFAFAGPASSGDAWAWTG